MQNVDGICIHTKAYVTTDNDQIGQIYFGQEELNDCRIAVHIGYEADVTAHLLDTDGKKIGVRGPLDTRAVTI